MLAKSCKVVSFFYSCSQPSNRRSSLLPDHPPVDHADYFACWGNSSKCKYVLCSEPLLRWSILDSRTTGPLCHQRDLSPCKAWFKSTRNALCIAALRPQFLIRRKLDMVQEPYLSPSVYVCASFFDAACLSLAFWHFVSPRTGVGKKWINKEKRLPDR